MELLAIGEEIMGRIIKYEHYGKEVSVDEDLRGKHREHCLCWRCEKFHPDIESSYSAQLRIKKRRENCPIANHNYAMCVKFNVVTPIYECPEFKEKK